MLVTLFFVATPRRQVSVIPSDLRDAVGDQKASDQLSDTGSMVPVPKASAPRLLPDKDLNPSQPPAGETMAPPVQGDVCGDGKPHTFRVAQNRDRLLATLAEQKGTDVCTLWSKLSLAEQAIFNMTTAFLGSCDSRLQPPPSRSDETVLDHAQKLYSINAPGMADVTASPVPSMGGACGGYNSNRAFLGFDQAAIEAMRASHGGSPLNPKHQRGYNTWRASNDPGGAHTPFTQRDMICWGGMPCWLKFGNSLGPTMHFFAKDSDLKPEALCGRRGVCGIKDPYLGEVTIAFNGTHESDPLCGQGRLQQVEQKEGEGFFDTYVPHAPDGGACSAARANSAPDGGGTHFGLGPDKIDGTSLK